MNLLAKLIFLLRKPKIIIVTGNGRLCAAEAIFQVLNQHFSTSAPTSRSYGGSALTPGGGGKVKKLSEKKANFLDVLKNGILIFETKLKNPREFSFFIKNSKLPILVVTQIGEIPPDKDFFAGEKKEAEEIKKLAKILPSFSRLILNFDDETVREMKDETNLFSLTFGFQEKTDFRASDLKLNSGINFKINYQGNIVPIWLDYLFGKEQIYSALAAAVVGIIFDLNLVEISQALRFYKGLPGKMRLISGIKNSWILDDSESATLFSMIEALEILGKINIEELTRLRQASVFADRSRLRPTKVGGQGRKIAILGDVLGIGKYTIEAHEAIGEKVVGAADLLFTIGARAKFIAQGAKNKGFLEENIFQFDEAKDAILALKTEIKENDLILIDGSTEMKMGKIVKEIVVS